MKKLLILSYTSSVKDPRVFKEWTCLHNDFDITIAGWQPVIPDVDFIEIRKKVPSAWDKLKFGLGMLTGNPQPFLDSFELDFDAVKDRKFDLVLCNDLFPLPLAFKLAKGAPVFWDAHEYYPEEHEESFLWRLLFKRNVMKIAKQYIPRVAAMSTVCPAIADRYVREYGVKPPLIVRNVPEYQELQPVMHKKDEPVRLLYIGDAHPGRKIETFIRMMKFLDNRFTLDLILLKHEKYQEQLKCLAAGDSRIRFIPPVPLTEVCRTINCYDVGLAVFSPTNFNYDKILPNKLFEYIQGRLAILSGPSSEISQVVRQYDLGRIASGFDAEDLSSELQTLTDEEINQYKSNTMKAADELCAEKELVKLKEKLLELAGKENKPC